MNSFMKVNCNIFVETKKTILMK